MDPTPGVVTVAGKFASIVIACRRDGYLDRQREFPVTHAADVERGAGVLREPS